MRRVEKGDCPQKDGADIAFSKYQEARPALVDQLGGYCSYCEMPVSTLLAVEHIRPKGVNGSLELEWTNFLLACGNCNPTKGHADLDDECYLWPHRHNTFYALAYGPGALVKPNADLSPLDSLRAKNIINLVGLDKRSGNIKTMSDRRWIRREGAWRTAAHSLDRLVKNDSPELRETIADLAQATRFFSVWMTVFTADTDMLERILNVFPGTALDCFVDGQCLASVTRPAREAR